MPQSLLSRAVPVSTPDCHRSPSDPGADLTLVTEALAGQTTAREALADRMLCIPGQVRIRMRRYGIRPSDDEVSDISQEIFAAIWERLERYRGDCPLEGWAYGFVARVTLAAMRRHVNRQSPLSEEEAAALEKAPGRDSNLAGDVVGSLLLLLKPQDERIIQLR